MQKTSAWPLALIYVGLILYASLYPFEDWRAVGITPWTLLAAQLPRYWTGFDVAANLLGSCYGSSGPAELSDGSFPALTTADLALAHVPLIQALGIQHIALRVDDIEAAIADLQEKGVRMIDTKPRYGAGGASIAFVHPKSSYGVLVELCQHK